MRKELKDRLTAHAQGIVMLGALIAFYVMVLYVQGIYNHVSSIDAKMGEKP